MHQLALPGNQPPLFASINPNAPVTYEGNWEPMHSSGESSGCSQMRLVSRPYSDQTRI